MAYYALIAPAQQWQDANGNPQSGYKLFTYEAGTTTKKTTYTDDTGAVANANPIILDSAGMCPAGMFGTSGAYKLLLAPPTDSDPPLSPVWTRDGIAGINDVTASAPDEWVTSALTPTYISASSFSLAGDQTSTFQVGRRIRATLSGGTRYGIIIGSTFGAGITTIVVTLDANTLDATISAVAYGLLSATPSSIPLVPGAVGGSLQLLQAITTAGAQTNADLALNLTNFDEFIIFVDNWSPNTAGSGFWLRSSADGVTYRTANYQWARNNLTTGGANSPTGSASDAKVELANDVGSGQACGTIIVRSLSGLGVRCEWALSCVTNAGLFYRSDGAGYYAASADGYIRLTNSTGTITNDCVIRLYGVKKA